MDIALQRRRLYIALGVTAVALLVAMAAVVATFGFHAAWGMWLFVAAILIGFGSHGWLILGVARERKAP
jgi:Na+/H+-dicarboxylate symporter